jgi:hypothetical protein
MKIRSSLQGCLSKVSGWPKRCKLACAFPWECSYKRLKLAQLLGQLGAFLTLLSLSQRSTEGLSYSRLPSLLWAQAVRSTQTCESAGESAAEARESATAVAEQVSRVNARCTRRPPVGASNRTAPGTRCGQACMWRRISRPRRCTQSASTFWRSPSRSDAPWACLGVDAKVIVTPPCIFCMDNH